MHSLINPERHGLPNDPLTFLRWLGGPTHIKLSGRDSSRSRCVVTLLHGNEPSGLRAILRYLHSGATPCTDIHFIIVSVNTALTDPPFLLRQLPGERDMNRCFAPPFDVDGQGHLAQALLRTIEAIKPEVIVDLHNTSGNGPAFSVCTELTREQMVLTALFTERMVITDLRMGTLMEINRRDRPAITIECGGAADSAGDQVAYQGLCRLLENEQLFCHEEPLDLDIYHHPVRLELLPECDVAYSDEPAHDAAIVLPSQIDRRNFGVVTPDIPLAWVHDPACLRLKTGAGVCGIEDFFTLRQGRLYAAHPLKLFMVTTNPAIARSDCLLYAVKEMDHEQLHTLLAQ